MSEISIKLHTVDDRVKQEGVARENPTVVIDYFPPFGEGAGYTSQELLLISLSSCLSTTMLTLIRGKMKRTITAMAVETSGTTRETHPKAFTHIRLALTITSPDILAEEVQKAIDVSEEKLCPVWALLKGNVEITVEHRILRP